MATAGSIVIDLLMKTGSFETDTKRAEKRLQEMQQTAKKWGLAIGAAGLAAGAGFAYMLKRQIDLMDNMAKAAQQAGTTTEALSSLGYAAELSGSSQDEMTASLVRLARSMGDAQAGSQKTVDAFRSLGVSVEYTDGRLRNTDEVFADLADRFSKMEDGARKTALAQDIFGRSGAKLIPMLNAGRGGLEEMRKEAERLGIVIDGDAAKAAERFNDNISRLQKIGQGWVNEIATQAIPILDAFTQQMWAMSTETDVMGSNAENLQKQKISDWARTATMGIAALADIIATAATGLSSFGAAFDALTSGAALRYQQAVRAMGNLTLDLFSIVTPEEKTREMRMGIERAYTDAFNAAIEARRNLDKKTAGFEFGYYTNLAQSTLDGIETGEIEPYTPGKPSGRLPTTTSEASSFTREQEKAVQDYQRFIDDITGRADAARQAQQEAWLYHALTIGDITGQEFANAMNSITGAIDEESQSFWERYLEGAEEALSSFDELSHDVIKNFTSGFGNAFESMIFDSQSLGDAFGNMAEGMARSVVNALGQMAAQWLAYQAVQMIVGQSAQAAGASGLMANATATSLQAGLAAYASTAAIPIVGPGLAPAAMATALATTGPMAAAVGAAAMTGMAHDGIDSVPKTGTWLLEKGERVMTADTSARMDGLLERIERGKAPAQGNSSPPLNVSVNLIEDESRAGQVSQRQTGDREYILDVVVSDIMGGGRVTKTGMQHLGWKRHGT